LTKVVDVLDAGHIREVRCLKKNVVNLEWKSIMEGKGREGGEREKILS
jgi:hypothetical protein